MLIAKHNIKSVASKKEKMYALQGDQLQEIDRSVCADDNTEFVLLVKNVRTGELFHTRSANLINYVSIAEPEKIIPKVNYKIEFEEPIKTAKKKSNVKTNSQQSLF